jgi:FMN phosphatase YigB (HAD superfamily)
MDDQLKNVTAVLFDLYGTLVQIGAPRKPYRQLLSILANNGRQPQPDDGRRLMSCGVDLEGAAAMFGRSLIPSEMAVLRQDLSIELASIAPVAGAIETIVGLKEIGIRVGICSNLAVPYAAPALKLLPSLDAYAWSFEVGAVKPDREIYEYACKALGTSPENVLMVGDTLVADYEGPRAFGMQARLLRADGGSGCLPNISEVENLLRIART